MPTSSLLSRKRVRTLHLPPPAVLMLMYGACILVGSLLLLLPFAATQPTHWFDALFTAVSAVTVTGLEVVHIGIHYTFFGQLVILTLIQLGGLGLMTFAVLVLAMLDIPSPVGKQLLLLREDLNQTDLGSLMRLVKAILKVVLIMESVGAILLTYCFVPELGFFKGVWYAIFHSVSALNNAGFSLFSDNLLHWAADPLINLVVPGLFITGGLGYAVLADIHRKRRWRTLSLHSKLMLIGTAGLIAWAMLAFIALEWHNPATLGQFDSVFTRLMVSWFQAVTTRTAGFNTIDISQLTDSTSLMMMPLMVIGGGSTSTAGGIKVTTFIVMLLAAIAFFKRQDYITAFGRSLGVEQILKVMALTSMSMLVILTSLFIITTSNHQSFIDLAFEVCSAFGTVGLSRGVTNDLDAMGRVVIMVTMFIGRIGPLALGFFLATRSAPRVRYPPNEVFLGYGCLGQQRPAAIQPANIARVNQQI